MQIHKRQAQEVEPHGYRGPGGGATWGSLSGGCPVKGGHTGGVPTSSAGGGSGGKVEGEKHCVQIAPGCR